MREIPTADYPHSLILPVYSPARFLRGLGPDGTGITDEDGGWWSAIDQDLAVATAQKHGAKSITLGTANPWMFARMIAKIGHGFAVIQLGVNGFDHLATDMILGRNMTMNHLVGCGHFEDIPAVPGAHHRMAVMIDDESGVVAVLVRLFADLGAPTYHVIVGISHGAAV